MINVITNIGGRMVKKGILALSVVLLAAQVSFAAEADLHNMGREKSVIKVFVGDISNESGQAAVSVQDFKKSLEDTLANRKSVSFELVKTPEESDIKISAIIKKFQYLKNDPVTTYGTSWGLLLDAATTENYAELIVNFAVMDSKSGNTLWKQDVMSFTKKMMSQEESIPLIYEKETRTFVSKCFGKGRP